MFPAEIEHYFRPQSVGEIHKLLANYPEGDATLIAGGQSLMQAIKSRMLRPVCLIDLQDVADLQGIDNANGLTIGAMTRYAVIAGYDEIPVAYAAIRDAASHVGDRQVRNRGTIGGSVCWNYVASCMPTVVLGTNGCLRISGADGEVREVAADDFFFGPFETACGEDEILLSVSWPTPSGKSGSAYKKWGLATDALPVVGMCVSLSLDGGNICNDARVAIAGLADGGQLVTAGGAALLGFDGNPEAIGPVTAAVIDSVECQSDHWASAVYREQLIRNLGAEVIERAYQRATAAQP
ncbi:MAG: FAD binding domain-containing protein [Pseudomonadota bacterium]